MSDYTAPAGNALFLNLKDTASPPAGDSVVLDLVPIEEGEVFVSGIAAGSVGSPSVVNHTRYISVAGSSHEAYGTPVIINAIQYITAAGGINQYKSGFVGGESLGNGGVFYYIRNITPPGQIFTQFGTALVAPDLRYLAASGANTAHYGLPLVTYSFRHIYPEGFPALRIDSGHLIGRHVTLYPVGNAMGGMGSPIVDYGDRIFPSAIGSPGFGAATVSRSPQLILQGSTAYDPEWGRPEVFNSVQYIRPNDWRIQDGPLVWGEKFPPFSPFFENRNRTITTQGVDTSKIPRAHLFENSARQLLPKGISAGSFGSETNDNKLFVSFKIRTVITAGSEEYRSTRFNHVHNSARIVAPAGVAHAAFGTHRAWFNRQTIKPSPVQPPAIIGISLVAYSVRTVAQAPYSMNSLHIPYPLVDFAVRTIAPASIDLSQLAFGGPFFEARKIRFYPKAILPSTKWGDAQVRNKTPAIKPYSYEQTLWGKPLVRRDKYYIRPAGQEQTTFTRLNKVSDSHQDIITRSISAGYFGWARAAKQSADPPANQFIKPYSLNDDSVVPNPVLNNIICDGWIDARFGDPVVVGNTIFPSSINPLAYSDQWGVPSLNATQWITVDPFEQGNEESNIYPPPPDYEKPIAEHGKPEISPLTIWCQTNTPQQAIDNHPGEAFREVGYDLLINQFGNASVQLATGHIIAVQSSQPPQQTLYGTPTIQNLRRYIYPEGKKLVKFGIPTIPGDGMPILVGEMPNATEFGDTSVINYIPPFSTQHISIVEGLQGLKISRPVVENFNRVITGAGGINGFSIQQGSTPILYNPFFNPYYGPRIPIAPAGIAPGDISQKHYVDFKIRTILPTGIEAYSTGYEWGYLRTDTKVKHKAIETYGFAKGAMGRPTVGYANRWPAPELKPLVCPIGWGD